MKSKNFKSNPKGEAFLVGLNNDHTIVCEERMSVVAYYESLHPILDDDHEYRKKRGIRYVEGKIYGYDGSLDQQFSNEYDEDGIYVRNKMVFADGTVAEN